MKGESVILIVTIFFIVNAYKDNKYSDYLKSMKKYYNMAIIGFAGLSFYLFIKKYPSHAYSGISAARQLVKTLPVDQSASYLFDPLFQNVDFGFTKKPPLNPIPSPSSIYQRPVDRITTTLDGGSGFGAEKTTKRSVSETKKKFVASEQNWKCGQCQNQLNAWFEIDHKHSLEKGGTNHISNLVALCRECHGKKTAMERMGVF